MKKYFKGIIGSLLLIPLSVVFSIVGVFIAIFLGCDKFSKYLRNFSIGFTKGILGLQKE